MNTTDKFELFFEKTDYRDRCAEFRNSVKRGQDSYDVVLPWSHFHSLDPASAARVFDDPTKADEYASEAIDQIITTDLRNAASLAAAFDILCAYAWTPNQSSDEAGESRVICDVAKKIIEHDSKILKK